MQSSFEGFEIDATLQGQLKAELRGKIAGSRVEGEVNSAGIVNDALVDTFRTEWNLESTAENSKFVKDVLQGKANDLQTIINGYEAAQSRITVSESDLQDLNIKDNKTGSLAVKDLVGKDADYIRAKSGQDNLTSVEKRALEALTARLEQGQARLDTSRIALDMVRKGSSDYEYKSLSTDYLTAKLAERTADVKVKEAEVALMKETRNDSSNEMFSAMIEHGNYNIDLPQARAAFGDISENELGIMLDNLLQRDTKQLSNIQTATESKTELYAQAKLAGIREGKGSQAYFEALKNYVTQSNIAERLIKGETIGKKEIDAIKKEVDGDLNLGRDFISRLDISKVEAVIKEYRYIEYGNEAISELVDSSLADGIENLNLNSNVKQEILNKVDELKRELMTDAKTDSVGRRWELLQSADNFKEFLGITEKNKNLKLTESQLTGLDTMREALYQECSQQLSFEKFLESKGKDVQALMDSAQDKVEKDLNLTVDEALVYTEKSLKQLLGQSDGKQKYLNPDQMEAVLTFLEGKSIEQKAGAGKTEVALTYMEIMSLVHGKNFNGMIITDSSVASSKYINRNFAGKEGLKNKELLDKMGGRKLVNGSELFETREYGKLLDALNDSKSIVVIDYTNFGHMHNLYYEAPKLVEAIENINSIVADEIHMSVSGKQSYITSAPGTPVNKAKIDKIDALRNELLNSKKTENNSYDELRTATDERVFYNAQERLYGVSESLRSRLVKEGFVEGEIDSVLRGLRDVETINKGNSFGVEEQMIHPTSEDGRIMTNSRISDVNYTLSLALELNARAEVKFESAKNKGEIAKDAEFKNVVNLDKITEANTDRHTSLLEIFDKNATILGMTATAQGRLSLISAGIGTEVKTISRTKFSLENFEKMTDEAALINKTGEIINKKNGYNIILASPDPATREKMAQQILEKFGDKIEKENLTAVIFPEGTRSKIAIPKPFRESGLKMMVKKAPSSYIIPLSINNSWRLVRKGAFPLGVGIKVTMEAHEPIKSDSMPFEALLEKTEGTIKEALQKLNPDT